MSSCVSTFFENIDHQQIEFCLYSQFTIRAHPRPTRLLCAVTVEVVFTALSMIRWHNVVRENIPVKYIFNVKSIHCVCVCVSEEHSALRRLSVSDAGSDWSSRLWEERADPQTVPGSV